MRLKKPLLFGALAVTCGVLLLGKPGNTPEAPVANPDQPTPRTGTPDPLTVPDRKRLARTPGELFAAPPPPPRPAAPAQVAAPVPVAPPLPYRFAGKLRKDSEEDVFLAKGELVFPVKVGETLDGVYKVESIGADGVELSYLPLGTRDRIAVSSVFEAAVARAPALPTPAPAASAAQSSDLAGGQPAQLRWEGPDRVQAGTSFNVALRVSTREPLRAAPMQIRFQPDVLEPLLVRPGRFFGDGTFSYRVNPAGSIFVGATSNAVAPGTDAELVIVTLRPIKRGATAELSMSALSLQGVAGRAIAHEQVSAFRATIQ